MTESHIQRAAFARRQQLQKVWQRAFDDAFLQYRQAGKSEDWAIYLAEHDADDIVLKYSSAHPRQKATP
jgi:hypothetical protein